jgi:hypothetical protein
MLRSNILGKTTPSNEQADRLSYLGPLLCLRVKWISDFPVLCTLCCLLHKLVIDTACTPSLKFFQHVTSVPIVQSFTNLHM